MCIRDSCRHTTFSTELKDVTITEGEYKAPIEATYEQYLACLLYTSNHPGTYSYPFRKYHRWYFRKG